MKKITLFLMALVAMTVNAKTFTTTLWEGSSAGGAEINIAASNFSSAKSGDAIRVTFSFTAAGSMHLCYKTGEGGDWSAKAFNSISEWPYYSDTNVSSAEFSINATDLTILQTYGMYIYGFTSSTITKVELTGEVTSTGETELLDANWTASGTAKVFSAQAGAKVKDVIQFTYTAYKDEGTAWPWVTLNLKDSDDGDLDAIAVSKAKGSENTYEYEITDFDVLDKIQAGGFKVTGQECIVTSVKLLTYADSYTPVSVTIGSDGIATWSHDQNLDFTGTGITAYYASAADEGVVTLTSTTTTWNWQGYILKGAAKTYRVGVIPDSEATFPSGNLLRGQVSEGTVYRSVYSGYSGTDENAPNVKTKYRYIFAKDGSDIGFYKLMAEHTLGAHKAYLETSTDVAPTAGARVALVFDDELTGISNIKEVRAADGAYYSLSGQRIIKPSKGLYIVNGKKIIIK